MSDLNWKLKISGVAFVISCHVNECSFVIINNEEILLRVTQINDILTKNAPKSRERNGSTRTYGELIETVFDIDITRIERTPDENEISFKWCDYSVQSIDNLIKQGVKDILKVMIEQSLQRNNQEKSTGKNEIPDFIKSVEEEKQSQELDEQYARLLVNEANVYLG